MYIYLCTYTHQKYLSIGIPILHYTNSYQPIHTTGTYIRTLQVSRTYIPSTPSHLRISHQFRPSPVCQFVIEANDLLGLYLAWLPRVAGYLSQSDSFLQLRPETDAYKIPISYLLLRYFPTIS